MIEKHSQTKYIVLDPTVAIPGGVGTVALAGDLYDNASGTINLITQGVGIFGPVAGSGNYVEASVAPSDAIQIIKRRNTVNDTSPLYTRLFEQSDWVNAACSRGIVFNATAVETGSNSSQLVGSTNAALSGKIDVTDNLNYQIQVSGHGDRTDWFNGGYNTPTTFGFYQAPDFTALGLSEIDARDLITQELALDFNSKARMMSFVMCIDSIGAGPGTGDVLVSVLANPVATPVGTRTIIGYDQQGRQHSFVMTKTIQQSLIAAAAFLLPTAVMKPYVVPGTTSGPAAAVAAVAGTGVDACDHLYVMALDEAIAQYDYKVNSKRRIEVGLVTGFTTTTLTEISLANEGHGEFRQLDIQYRKHNRMEETHRSRFPYQSYYLEFQNDSRPDATYDYFFIEHCDHRTATSGIPSNNNFTTVIAIVSFEDATTPYFTGAANPQKTYIQDALNAFIAANGLSNPVLAI